MATAATLYIPFDRIAGTPLPAIAIDGSETAITIKRQNNHDYLDSEIEFQINGQSWKYSATPGPVAYLQLGDGQTVKILVPGGDASRVIYVKGDTGAGYIIPMVNK